MSQRPGTEDRNPHLRANSLDELLSWNDLDFVRCAYVTMLGRQPDLPGQAHYVDEIRAGTSKLDVLWRLRRSPEAKAHDPGIAGLDRALRRAAWQRRPLAGAISRLLMPDADSQSRSDRALRALMNATLVNRERLDAISDRLTLSSMAAASGDLHHEQAVADPLAPSPAPHQGLVELTPELDHLRTRRPARLPIGGGAL